MAERFLKFIPSEEALWLLDNKPNAFKLLTHIANTARRYNGHPDGLTIGQCHLQHWTVYNLTEREYRTAKDILVSRKHLVIVETNRSRKKSTTGTTTKSTLVSIISSTVYDINPETNDDRNDDRATTDRRLTDDKQEGSRKNQKEKEDHHPYPSSPSVLTDDFSSKREEEEEPKFEVIEGVFLSAKDLQTCIKIKGDIEKVKHAVAFIHSHPKRKSSIEDWPNALSNWKIENKSQAKVEESLKFAEELSRSFANFDDGFGWRCYLYHDRNKDQRGLLFEPESAYKEAVFIALIDGEFREKCESAITKNRMVKNETSV